MDIQVYITEQNILVSMIGVYMLFTILQEVSFAAMLKFSPKLINRSTALLTPFSAIMGKFVFITDGLIKKNIYQIKAYSFLIIYILTTAGFGFIKTTDTGLIFNIITIVLILLDGLYTFYQVKSLENKYTWYFYKKLGLSEELQNVNKLKQRVNVFYKLNIFLTITNFEYPVSKSIIVTSCNYICFFSTLFSTFLYSMWEDEENRTIRKAVIFINIFEMGLELLEFIVLLNKIIYYNIFVLVSLFFSLINSTLYIYYLYLDMQTFGHGYSKALKQNVRKKRNALESTAIGQ